MMPPESKLVRIEKPVYGGAFLARLDGKAIFTPLTLPGEEARIRIVEDKRAYATAEAEEIVQAAPQRIAPDCRHFGACGGCHYQHADYEAQVKFKREILLETLERAGVRASVEIGVLVAEPWRYRNRIRLAFDAAGDFGYRGRRSHAVVPISECPIAAPILLKAATAFTQAVRIVAPRLRPTEISLLCNADESALVASVFVDRPAKESFNDLARAWAEQVPSLAGVELVLSGRGDDRPRTVDRWGADSLAYHAAGFDYRVDHGAFFQVNRWLVDDLVERVAADCKGKLVWDLYAGVGLFARKLASKFERVIAVESASPSLTGLKENLKGVHAEAIQSDTLSFLRRQKDARPDLIVVDPPRTGLGPETATQLIRIAPPAITYVSCDPATLARDLRALTSSGYTIEAVTLVDLFPQTFHLETMVKLRRN
jgi:23S rRNA (uracil1939-C5)-methyltransferase